MLLAILVLAAGSCSVRPASAWQPASAEAVAWWIEDVAHGLTRLPGEVAPVDGNGRDHAIARWAAGSDILGRWVPPRQLAARRSRWPAIAAALSEGTVQRLEAEGLLVAAPTVTPSRRGEVDALIDSENIDRRFVDGLILVMASPDPQVEEIYRQAILSARRMHDAVPVAQPDLTAGAAR